MEKDDGLIPLLVMLVIVLALMGWMIRNDGCTLPPRFGHTIVNGLEAQHPAPTGMRPPRLTRNATEKAR